MGLPIIAVEDSTGNGVLNFPVSINCKGFMYLGADPQSPGPVITISPDSPQTVIASGTPTGTPAATFDGIPLRVVGSFFKFCAASSQWYFSIASPGTANTYYFMPITDDVFDCDVAYTPTSQY